MLSEETHERLRRLARRRGVPLAVVIREALTDVAQREDRATLSFIGAADVEGVSARETREGPRLSPFRSDPPLPEHVDHFRRLAEKRERERSEGC